jgi:hypothetical protein
MVIFIDRAITAYALSAARSMKMTMFSACQPRRNTEEYMSLPIRRLYISLREKNWRPAAE